MRDTSLNETERPLQLRFIKWLIAGAFLWTASDSRTEWPDRAALPDRAATITYSSLRLSKPEGVAITGAWQVTADDPRFGGLSALAVLADGRLQAISDSGVRVIFPPGGIGGRALLADLPAGPGYPTFKKYRDSEAMIVDPDGKGALVAFENRHSLWRYRWGGGAAAVPLALPSARWRVNKGIEAMVVDPADGALLMIPEASNEVLRIASPNQVEVLPLLGATGGIADAARLPDGRIVVAVREIGLLGLTNRLAWLERDGRGYRLRNFATLPLGPFDNVEGLAAETKAAGGTQLWAVTDNDGWRRTLLLRLELDARKAPAETGA